MESSAGPTKTRRQSRTKAVLPVRVRGKDKSGKLFDDLAHTLDVTSTGVRLGSVKFELKEHDRVTILYRQRRMEFRVVWMKKMKGSDQYQVGLEALTSQRDAWGLSSPTAKVSDLLPVAVAHASSTA